MAGCSVSKKTASLAPVPSSVPNEAQKKQIERKYGMFIHFGINTFHDQEWTDGTLPPSSYKPTAIDAEQWVQTAKAAGMKYVILVTKHHDGFCLWDSKYTTYDVAESGNKTNVIEALAKACAKSGIRLGLYYSLWDRHHNDNVKDSTLDAAYNKLMTDQLAELIDITKKHTSIVEFWFDGGWTKPNHRWPVEAIYQTIKSREPECQVGINWSIGAPGNPDQHMVLPTQQKEGYPIRYFPSDFRIGDPYLPANPDPKVFSHDGKYYYMPWESTVCMSGKWFYNTQDTKYKSLDQLEDLFKKTTTQDNILIINSPPSREGKMRDKDVEMLSQLRERLGL
ncbi:calcium:sodium exchange protein [Chitinophaga barathri]|uniref:alpha-L-fucosidase n=2 Tax=Chitinophaga barathri TaxID=1647451 RepID=A0A3N4M601_9BACT|nr:calcium:sodium exchange protein [Chitinophaga barathri]